MTRPTHSSTRLLLEQLCPTARIEQSASGRFDVTAQWADRADLVAVTDRYPEPGSDAFANTWPQSERHQAAVVVDGAVVRLRLLPTVEQAVEAAVAAAAECAQADNWPKNIHAAQVQVVSRLVTGAFGRDVRTVAMVPGHLQVLGALLGDQAVPELAPWPDSADERLDYVLHAANMMARHLAENPRLLESARALDTVRVPGRLPAAGRGRA